MNAFNGNLIVQDQDDYLAARGLDLTAVRTYNSQAKLVGGRVDAWAVGSMRERVIPPATWGSGTLRRVDADGAEALYSWDSANARYSTPAGAGAFDTVKLAGGSYVWTDGASGSVERYDATGRLISASDADGSTISYGYDGANRLQTVTGANGETLTYTWSTGGDLTEIRTSVAAGPTARRVQYEYDTSTPDRRLTKVTVDLTPADNSTADAQTYTTSYTYVGASTRLLGITQSDTSSVTFGYDAQGRVTSITDALNRTTTIAYDSATQTTITDPSSIATVLTYDSAGNLKVYRYIDDTAATPQTTTYTNTFVEAEGYRLGRVEATGASSNYTVSGYDANGQLIWISDRAQREMDRKFINDAAGMTVATVQGDHIKRQLIINGEVLGSYGSAMVDVQANGKSVTPTFDNDIADFALGYRTISATYPGATPGTYTVRTGDTLRGLAQSAYGDARKWAQIANANGLRGDADLRVGQTITIPTVVTSGNGEHDFAPYEAGKMVGDTRPATRVRNRVTAVQGLWSPSNPTGPLAFEQSYSTTTMDGGGSFDMGDFAGVDAQIEANMGDWGGDYSGSFDGDYGVDGPQDDINTYDPTGQERISKIETFTVQSYNADGIPQSGPPPTERDVLDIINDPTGYGYANQMDQASDSYNPATAYGYTNGMDVASDTFSPADRPGLDRVDDFRRSEREYRSSTDSSVAGSGYVAVAGDSISRIAGSSSPQVIGNFMIANNLNSDQVQAGRNYFVPTNGTAYGNATALGQFALDQGNARISLAAATEMQRELNRLAGMGSVADRPWDQRGAGDGNMSALEYSRVLQSRMVSMAGNMDPGADWQTPNEMMIARLDAHLSGLPADQRGSPEMIAAMALGIAPGSSRATLNDPIPSRASIGSDARGAQRLSGVPEPGIGASAADAALLRGQLIAQEIAGGHAFDKHVIGVGNPSGAEFSALGIQSRQQFAGHLETVISSATHTGQLRGGREYFYDSRSNTILIRNPTAPDGGTAFRIDLNRYPNPTDYLKTLR
ncbi:MAG: LysM peptidoglycan-binding domain-containing protein [Pseudomonadota bacterium]